MQNAAKSNLSAANFELWLRDARTKP
jgi:hypothetical protein